MDTSGEQSGYLYSGLFLLVIGGATTGLYYALKQIVDLFYRTFVVSVTVDNKNDMFTWLVRWLAEMEEEESRSTGTARSFFKSQNLTLHLRREKTQSWWRDNEADDEVPPTIEFLPGPGTHIFYFKEKLIWMYRHQSNKVTTMGWDRKPFISETISLNCYGRDHKIFEEMFMHARESCIKKDNDKTRIYVLGEYASNWDLALSKHPRAFDSVILDSDLASQIYDDAKEFLSSAAWYQSMGTPYRRGYLLYGPPGCGKTSFVLALASQLRLNICVVTLSNHSLDDQRLNLRLHDAPPNSIVLLEDIDAVFVDRNTAKDHYSRVTFSGLLNAIDGVASQEGRLFMMTTNHVEKLDPALLRPGRCDVKALFKLASKNQLERMFARFYEDSSENIVKQFVDTVPENTVSMAAVQEHLMRHKCNPQAAIDNYEELLKQDEDKTVKSALKYTIGAKNITVKDDSLEQMKFINKGLDEMAIWLRRLGLSCYIKAFQEQRIFCLKDLKSIDTNSLYSDFKIEKTGDVERIVGMITGRDDICADFEFATEKIIHKLFVDNFTQHFKSVAEIEPVIDEFISKLTAPVSILQVKDHLHKYKSPQLVLNNMDDLLNPPHDCKKDPLSVFNPHELIIDWVKRTKNEDLFHETLMKHLNENDILYLEQLIALGDSDWDDFKVKPKGIIVKLQHEVDKLKKLCEKAEKMNSPTDEE